jgi:hypothetical protein
VINLPRYIRRVLLELALWLLLELLCNANGLDALEDFGEFVFARKTHLLIQELAKF